MSECLCALSSRGAPPPGGGGGGQLHGPEGDVALADSGPAARADPWLPGALRAGGERRGPRAPAHQRRDAGGRSGRTLPHAAAGSPTLQGCKPVTSQFQLKNSPHYTELSFELFCKMYSAT